MDIRTILSLIDIGTFALPEFQRGYVWNRDQVRKLMLSLYKRYPIGGLLVWTTNTDGAKTRGPGELYPGTVKLILDGQQRITSLYGIINGRPPKFFDGNSWAFTGLYFNLKDEESTIKEANDWVTKQGLPSGEIQFELVYDENKTAYIDLAWPDGLQTGLSKPVALILNEEKEIEDILNKAGYIFYTNIEEFMEYVKKEILSLKNDY